jgi:lysophospholipid acyltransferase (LPLAT)-like uncharacterized protein
LTVWRRSFAVALRHLLGLAVGLLARMWLATLRVRFVAHPALYEIEVSSKPWVFAFFHGTQWPLLAWRGRRRTVVLVSLSLDGVMQARALRTLDLLVERGSSSRGGARGLVRVARRLRQGGVDAAFAVDGPRGPYGVVKGGARVAARAAEAVLVPVGTAFSRGFVLRRAWDRFGIALPFSRVAVCLGAPMSPSDAQGDRGLAVAITTANEEAEQVVAGRHRAEDPARSFEVA